MTTRTTAPAAPTAPPDDPRWAGPSWFLAVQERAVAAFLFVCAAVIVLTTAGIILVLGAETFEFFERSTVWDAAPERFIPQIATPTEATHQTELQFLFDLPDAPIPGPLTEDQERLAGSIRAAWSAFAASGDPAGGIAWTAFGNHLAPVLSLVAPQPQLATDFAARHRCAFWAATQ